MAVKCPDVSTNISSSFSLQMSSVTCDCVGELSLEFCRVPLLWRASGFAAHWMSLQIFLVNTVTGILCPLWDVITVWRRPYLSLCVWAIRGSAAFVLRLHRNKRVFLLYRRGGNSSRPLDHLEAAALWTDNTEHRCGKKLRQNRLHRSSW